jgi:hypothetical protein
MVDNDDGAPNDAPSSALSAQDDTQNAKGDPPQNSIKKAGFGGVNGGVKDAGDGGVSSGDELDDLLSELRAVPPGAKLYSKEHHGNYYAVYRWFEDRVVGGLTKRARPMRYVAPVNPKRKTKRSLNYDQHKEIKSNSRTGKRSHRRRS